jgi:23S rRNA pseudouridine1911/1915/1917 synthase
MRPGIVHRLDKETSGVMVAAKNDRSHRKLSEQFKDRRMKKTYLALVWDNMPADEGVIDLPIGRDRKDRKKISPRTGKPRSAVTRYRVKRRFGAFTLVELRPVTGRTHQIRVHLAHINHPVVGDPLYGGRGGRAGLPRQWKKAFAGVNRTMLHAHRLVFEHPADGRVMDLTARIPGDMLPFIEEGAADE